MNAVNNVSMSYIKFYNVSVNSNEAIKMAHLQRLSNQSMVNGTLVIEMVTILLVKARETLVVW